MHYLNRAVDILKQEGLVSLLKKSKNKIFRRQDFQKELDKALSAESYDVSIIIPVYNAVDFTVACIEKVYSVQSKATFEVIVVDNNSQDETKNRLPAFAKKKKNLSYYRLESNRGFSGGVNFGFKKAKGRFFVILNNDTLPTDHWLDLLIASFEEDPTLGIVSPMTNYVGQGPQLDHNTLDIKPTEVDEYAKTILSRKLIIEPHRLVFFCVMIRKSVIEQIGLLDEGYIKGNYEDDDYNLRAILSGYRLGIAQNAFVFHHGSVTFDTNRIEHTEHMVLNRKRFFFKAGSLSTTIRRYKSKEDNPLISIIVRTLNRPDSLKRALTSLSNQTFRQFEVVLVNDGGDSVQDIVDNFSKHFPITYVHHAESKGRTPALNAGINHVATDWVAILDDDDIVYPWHLEVLYKASLENPKDKVFYSNFNRVIFKSIDSYDPLILQMNTPWHYKKAELWVKNYIPIHTWLIHKSCFDTVGLFDETQTMLEDFEFLIRLSTKYTFCPIDRVTCEYRFYLDGINSMINNREKTYDALNYIYNKFETKDTEILENRDSELKALSLQIKKINALKEKLSGDNHHYELILQQMMRLILGY